MKLSEANQAYSIYSGKASDITRYLGFAGIALIWLFRIKNEGAVSIPHSLLWPAILLFVGLALDLFQYVAATLVWGIFHRIKEKQGIKEDEEVQASSKLNWPGLTFFWGKIFIMILAYILLIKFLYNQIGFN